MPAKVTEASALQALIDGVQRSARTRNIHRFVPLPKQELFLSSQAKNRLALGGNRSGKTEVGTADDVMIAMRIHPYRNHFYPPKGTPVRLRCIGVDFERGIDQTFLPKWQALLPPSALRGGAWETAYERGARMLYLEDKSTVSFMSYEQEADKFQSVSLHHIHFDEEPPEPIYKESVLRVLDTGGTMTITETPVSQMEWLEDRIVVPSEEGRLKSWQVVRMSTLDNVNLPVEELKELVADLTPEEVRIRVEGEYTGGTLVFPEFQRKAPYVIPHADFELTPEWGVFEGMDSGYAHPGAWEWMAVHRDGSVVSFAEEHHAGLVPAEWARLVKARRAAIRDEYGLSEGTWAQMFRGCIGDPAIGQVNNQTGITTQQAYALEGINIATEGIVKTRLNQGQNFGLLRMHTFLRRRSDGRPWWQLTDRVPGLADELRRARKPKQSFKVQESKAAPEEIRDKDNDTIDAVKYVFMVAHDLRPVEDTSKAASAAETNRQLHEQMRQRGAVQSPLTVQDVKRRSDESRWRDYGSDMEG